MDDHDYATLLHRFLAEPEEREALLYQLSLLGPRLIAEGYGPEDVVALHGEAMQGLPPALRAAPDWVEQGMALLLELMIAYGVHHREQVQRQVEGSRQRAEQEAAVALAEAEARLRHNRQKLQDRDAFIGFIAHELRRPLTTIQGHATLGQRHATALPKAEAHFQEIYRAAQQMGETCDLLLRLSQAEREHTLVEFRPVALDALLHASVAAVEVEQRALELAITLDIQPPPPIVQGDETALRAVFTNLLSNAVKYNRPHGEVLVRTRHVPGGVRVEVNDTGVGIPAAELPHIFDRYYRIRTAATERTHGSGLGLALVEYIVQQHGGQITVRSAEGEGSSFVVLLPLSQEAPPSPGAPALVTAAES